MPQLEQEAREKDKNASARARDDHVRYASRLAKYAGSFSSPPRGDAEHEAQLIVGRLDR